MLEIKAQGEGLEVLFDGSEGVRLCNAESDVEQGVVFSDPGVRGVDEECAFDGVGQEGGMLGEFGVGDQGEGRAGRGLWKWGERRGRRGV